MCGCCTWCGTAISMEATEAVDESHNPQMLYGSGKHNRHAYPRQKAGYLMYSDWVQLPMHACLDSLSTSQLHQLEDVDFTGDPLHICNILENKSCAVVIWQVQGSGPGPLYAPSRGF